MLIVRVRVHAFGQRHVQNVFRYAVVDAWRAWPNPALNTDAHRRAFSPPAVAG